MIDKDYINKILSDTSNENKENIIGSLEIHQNISIEL